jgi:hypothetical protein
MGREAMSWRPWALSIPSVVEARKGGKARPFIGVPTQCRFSSSRGRRFCHCRVLFLPDLLIYGWARTFFLRLEPKWGILLIVPRALSGLALISSLGHSTSSYPTWPLLWGGLFDSGATISGASPETAPESRPPPPCRGHPRRGGVKQGMHRDHPGACRRRGGRATGRRRRKRLVIAVWIVGGRAVAFDP